MRKIIEIIPIDKSITMALLETGDVVIGWVDTNSVVFEWKYELPKVPDELPLESEFKAADDEPLTATEARRAAPVATLHDAKKT